MRFATGCSIVLFGAIPLPASAAPESVKDGFELVWADEFDVDGPPDPAKWMWDTRFNRSGWHGGERQYYAADRLENARVEGGRLIITARHEALSNRPDYGGQHYTSARLTTEGRAEWSRGLIEVRAKLPCGMGLWPAIWTLGAKLPWPDGGSIDIMEYDGNAPAVMGTVHNRSTEGTTGHGGRLPVADACTAFHDYQLVWMPQELRFAVDGRPYHVYPNAGAGEAQWPFDKPHHLILSLAVRGADGVIDARAFPARFEIEHVRVYRQLAPAEGAGDEYGE